MTTVNQLRDFVAKENKLGEADMAKAVRARLEGKTGASLEETELIEGLLIDKDISHP